VQLKCIAARLGPPGYRAGRSGSEGQTRQRPDTGTGRAITGIRSKPLDRGVERAATATDALHLNALDAAAHDERIRRVACGSPLQKRST
jgi:hypothetical protein